MNQFDIRKYFISFGIIVLLLVLLVRLFYLQVVDDSYKISADNNSQRRVIQYPARGLIFDRNNNVIVNNEAAYDLMCIPNQIQEFDTLEFASLVELPLEEIQQIFAEIQKGGKYAMRKPTVFTTQLSAASYAALQERLYKFPGFYVQARTLRNYVRHAAPHLLGYVAEVDTNDVKDPYYRMGDYIGKSGLERYYEKELRGKKGVNIFLTNVHNQIVGSFRNGEYDTTAVVGSDLTISLDIELQEYTEKLMSKMRGAAVAIEPSTGEILAMVSVPNYDPALLVGRARAKNYVDLMRTPSKPLFDRAVMAAYPPGSTFKVAQALVALQQGIITPNTLYGCSHGYIVGNFRMGCHGHMSPLNLPQAIGNSCNAYFAAAFRAILDNKAGTVKDNYAKWRQDILAFGFGDKLGVDLPQELRGNVPTTDYYDKRFFSNSAWKSLRIVSLSIGQGEMGSTVLQMANFAAMIANEGFFYPPHFIKKVNGRDTIPPQFATKRLSGIDQKHFAAIKDGMYATVHSGYGTARGIALPHISVCGKTGTAQNPHGADNATFMAFAPKNDPKIAVAVYVENGGFGATWAAPVASLIIEKYLTDTITRPQLEYQMLHFNKYNNAEAVR